MMSLHLWCQGGFREKTAPDIRVKGQVPDIKRPLRAAGLQTDRQSVSQLPSTLCASSAADSVDSLPHCVSAPPAGPGLGPGPGPDPGSSSVETL